MSRPRVFNQTSWRKSVAFSTTSGASWGVAILIVEQHLDFAWSITERYYVMQRGTVVRSGTTAGESPEAIAPLLSV